MFVELVFSRIRIIPVQSVVIRSDPQVPCPVFVKAGNIIAAQAVGIVEVAKEMDKLLYLRIDAADASAVGSNPKAAGEIFHHRNNCVMTQAVGIIGLVAVVNKGFFRK